jgi:hypothetical protein
MEELLEIWQQAQTGDQTGARRQLVEVLREEPRNVRAWALMATLLSDPAQQADCYRRILRFDPGNRRAAAMLASLEADPGAMQTCPHCGAPMALRFGAACPYCGSAIGHEVALPDPFAEDFDGDGVIDVPMEQPDQEAVEEIAAIVEAEAEKQTRPPKYSVLTQYVIKELGGHQARHLIVREICLRTHMPWEEAETFVAEVERLHRREIAKRRRPITVLISGSVLIIGIILLTYSLHNIIASAKLLLEATELQEMEPLIWAVSELGNLLPGLTMVLGGLFGLARMFTELQAHNTD